MRSAFSTNIKERHTCQPVVDIVIGAANGANTRAVFAGIDPQTKQQYVYLETLGGGMAEGRLRAGVQVNITNTSNLPVDAIELLRRDIEPLRHRLRFWQMAAHARYLPASATIRSLAARAAT